MSVIYASGAPQPRYPRVEPWFEAKLVRSIYVQSYVGDSDFLSLLLQSYSNKKCHRLSGRLKLESAQRLQKQSIKRFTVSSDFTEMTNCLSIHYRFVIIYKVAEWKTL